MAILFCRLDIDIPLVLAGLVLGGGGGEGMRFVWGTGGGGEESLNNNNRGTGKNTQLLPETRPRGLENVPNDFFKFKASRISPVEPISMAKLIVTLTNPRLQIRCENPRVTRNSRNFHPAFGPFALSKRGNSIAKLINSDQSCPLSAYRDISPSPPSPPRLVAVSSVSFSDSSTV